MQYDIQTNSGIRTQCRSFKSYKYYYRYIHTEYDIYVKVLMLCEAENKHKYFINASQHFVCAAAQYHVPPRVLMRDKNKSLS